MVTGKQIVYAKAAAKALRMMDARASQLIRSKIRQYAADPASLANNVKSLKGVDALRLRVGDYRVIFTEDLVVLTILRVGHRRDVYE